MRSNSPNLHQSTPLKLVAQAIACIKRLSSVVLTLLPLKLGERQFQPSAINHYYTGRMEINKSRIGVHISICRNCLEHFALYFLYGARIVK